MKAKRKLPLVLILLLSIGLLLGGAVHSSLHADDHGGDEGGDCHVCHLTVVALFETGPQVGTPLELLRASSLFPASSMLAVPLSPAAPRGPPA